LGHGWLPGSRAFFTGERSSDPPMGEPLKRRKCIEPIHYLGGYRLPRLAGRES